jgi:hypothetical protein
MTTTITPAAAPRYRTAPSRNGRSRPLTARRVRKARRLIASEACPQMLGIQHRYTFDGYFWHRCVHCGRVS